MSREALTEIIFKYMEVPVKDLIDLKKDLTLPALDHFVMKIISEGINRGDPTRLDSLLDRCLGKVKQVVENIGDRPVNDRFALQQMHKDLVLLILEKENKEIIVEPTEPKGLLIDKP